MTYSSSLALNRRTSINRTPMQAKRNGYAKRNQNTASFRSAERTIGPISNTIILIVLACLLGLLYLTQVTKTNAHSYKLNDLRARQNTLSAERDQLEVDSARLQALSRVKNAAATKDFVSLTPSASAQN